MLECCLNLVTPSLNLLPPSLSTIVLACVIYKAVTYIYSQVTSGDSGVPELYFKKSPLNDHIVAKCQLLERPFRPCPWLSHRHLQSLLPSVLAAPEVTFDREYLQMRDKGVVALDWLVAPQTRGKKKRATILLVLPALTDDALATADICHLAAARGMRVVVFNRRGHGGTVLTTPRLQSFGDPSDLRQVIKYLHLRLPRAPIAAMALGTGCGLLMSYLGEFGSSAQLMVGACVSPCYDVPLRFSAPVPSVYDLGLVFRLKTVLWRHAPALAAVLDVDAALSAWTLASLDRAVFCPLYGYSDVDQLWEMNNPVRDVDDIEVPLLCVNALDDPTCSPDDIPLELFKCYPNFLLAVTKKGGHCGFLEGFPPNSWANSLCLDYVAAVVDFTTGVDFPLKQQEVTTGHQTRTHSLSTPAGHRGKPVTERSKLEKAQTGNIAKGGLSHLRHSSLYNRRRGMQRFTI